MSKKEKTIKCIVYECGKEPVVKEIPNTLEALQTAVGGYIEQIRLYDNMVILCDDEGRFKNLPVNRKVGSVTILGTFLLVGTSGSEYTSLNDWQIKLFVGG